MNIATIMSLLDDSYHQIQFSVQIKVL